MVAGGSVVVATEGVVVVGGLVVVGVWAVMGGVLGGGQYNRPWSPSIAAHIKCN